MVRTVLIGAVLAAACVFPIFSQESADPVIAANEAIARTAGRLLPAALDLTPGTDTVSVAVGSIAVDGQTPRLATLLSALVSDELFARASALRARRGIEVLAPGPMAGGSTLTLNISATTGESEAVFVVQIVDRMSGAIRASARESLPLTPAFVTALQPVISTGGGTSGGGGDPNDVSDDPAYAQSVALDSVVSGGRLHVEGDHDWFVIGVNGIPTGIDGIPAVTVYTSGSSDTYIEVYGPDSYSTFLNENDDGGENTNASITFEVVNNQTYWILVRGFGDSSTGSYDLHVETSVIEPDLYEPNDDMSSAIPVDPAGEDIFASLRPAGDVDWYEIDIVSILEGAASADSLSLAVETVSDMDTVMSVYDSNNNEIAYNDDGGDFNNARVLVPLNIEGPLFVEVHGYGDWVEGDYQLVISINEMITDEYEPDDQQGQAQSVEIGAQPQLRSFSSDSDVDWIRLEISADEYPSGAAVRMYTNGDIDTYMILYDRSESELARSDDDGFAYNAMIDRRLAPGTYYVEVYPLYLDTMNGEYTFAVDER